jgi:hypothetical protein
MVTAQDALFALVFVALLSGPVRGTEVCQIVAANIEAGRLPIE